jgi:hypothetical protein
MATETDREAEEERRKPEGRRREEETERDVEIQGVKEMLREAEGHRRTQSQGIG